MAKILEGSGPAGFHNVKLYRVRELTDGETAPEDSRPVVVSTPTFDWSRDTEPGVADAIAAADTYGKPQTAPEGA